LGNENGERIWKETVVAQRIGETEENHTEPLSYELNTGPPEYEVGKLTALTRRMGEDTVFTYFKVLFRHSLTGISLK
jgi:hypothetical protein